MILTVTEKKNKFVMYNLIGCKEYLLRKINQHLSFLGSLFKFKRYYDFQPVKRFFFFFFFWVSRETEKIAFYLIRKKRKNYKVNFVIETVVEVETSLEHF